MAGITWVVRFDELKIINDNQRQPAAALLPAGDGGDLGQGPPRGVVDEERGSADLRRLLHEPATVLLGDRAVAEPVTVDPRDGTEQAVGQLHGRHFQAHEQHRMVVGDRHVLGDVHRHRRLPHARPGGEDHKLGVVEPATEGVELREPGLHAAERLLVLHAGIHPLEHLAEHLVDRGRVGGAAVLEDREDLRFRPGEELLRLVGRVVGIAEDVGAGVDQRAEERFVADDLRVVRRMGGVGHRLHDLCDRRHAADPFEIPLRSESVEDDRRVDPLAAVVEVEEVAEEDLVGLVGEILRPEHEGDVVAGVRLQKDAAEHAALGSEIDRTLAQIGRAGPVAAVTRSPPPAVPLAVAPFARSPVATPTRCRHARASRPRFVPSVAPPVCHSGRRPGWRPVPDHLPENAPLQRADTHERGQGSDANPAQRIDQPR